MAKNKKATAKQSLKRRSKKMLCRRLDTMRRGNMYGGAYEAVRPNFGHPIARHNNGQNPQVQPSKDGLRQQDILSPICELIQHTVNVDVCGRINQGSGSAFDQGVVTFSVKVL
ncbi:MAG: hypothetical protein L6R35_002045 [Caloplaca aegaea]|nr:MAG: hypothetical protein L6R35_002045 [Caloplaca aegaea]